MFYANYITIKKKKVIRYLQKVSFAKTRIETLQKFQGPLNVVNIL